MVRFSRLVLVALAIYVAGIVAGFLKPSTSMLESVQQEVNDIAALPAPARLVVIFMHNTVAMLAMLAGSIIIVPGAVILGVNGFVVGSLANVEYVRQGVKGLATVALSLLPHGVIELAAYVYAVALGLRLAYSLMNGGKSRLGEMVTDTLASMYVPIAALFTAAVVEVYVTPKIIAGLDAYW